VSVLLSPADPAAAGAVPVLIVKGEAWPEAAARLGAAAIAFARAQGFDGGAGKMQAVPAADGALAGVLLGDDTGAKSADPFAVGRLATTLPDGIYRIEGRSGAQAETDALAFALSAYRFIRYRSTAATKAVRLVVNDGVDADSVQGMADAVAFGRDLINTPASDLGPAELEAIVRRLARDHGAAIDVVVGDDLLTRNFPMVHAVGRASSRAPRLVDMRWGEAHHPRVTLVGKGVCFDTGGLNIKPDASMLLMKKDMGGAATALTAARMIMEAKLPVRLRVIVPAVENAISGSAFRPGDVLHSRKGISVEIGNTDAEGRLILADALALADEDTPDLVLDFATLTGAARVALGPDLPPVYTDDDGLAAELTSAGMAVNDPVWRLPLWNRYDGMLDSKIADVNHISGGAFAGSITAALFLRRFVEKAAAWAHFDIFGWTPVARPGRPEGGEPQAARLVFETLRRRYGG
jgi:leucyl aminopeptidase